MQKKPKPIIVGDCEVGLAVLL